MFLDLLQNTSKRNSYKKFKYTEQKNTLRRIREPTKNNFKVNWIRIPKPHVQYTSRERIKLLKYKLRTFPFGHFWITFGYVSNIPVIRF